MKNYKSLMIISGLAILLSTLFILSLSKNKKQSETKSNSEIMTSYLSSVPNWCLNRNDNIKKNWNTLKKDQFKILYPKNFKISSQEYNFASFSSTQEKTFKLKVLSPLWTAKIEELLPDSNNNYELINKISKNKTLSCKNELGEKAKQINTAYLLKSKDKNKKILVIEIYLNNPETESETNRFFALKLDENNNFLNYKSIFLKFINSLEQYADA